MRVPCGRCGREGTGIEEWAVRLDGMRIERHRCGLCGYATSIMAAPPRHSSARRHPVDYIVTARWVGSNRWVA